MGHVPTRITYVTTPEQQAELYKVFTPYWEYKGMVLSAVLVALIKAMKKDAGSIVAAAFEGRLVLTVGERNASS